MRARLPPSMRSSPPLALGPISSLPTSPRTCTAQYMSRSVLSSPELGFASSDVSARSTRAGGAMALLCAGIDEDRIRLIGRWKSDEMYRYLHVQAQPVMTGVAASIFRSGHYRILLGSTLPTLPAPPPKAAPHPSTLSASDVHVLGESCGSCWATPPFWGQIVQYEQETHRQNAGSHEPGSQSMHWRQ